MIVSLQRFQAEGERLLAEGREVGVRIEPNEAVEDLAYDLPRIAVVALAFPKFRDGRAYSVGPHPARAVRLHRARCGRWATCCASRPGSWSAAASTPSSRPTARPPETWAVAARFRHVYQRAADGRAPAFVERAGAADAMAVR